MLTQHNCPIFVTTLSFSEVIEEQSQVTVQNISFNFPIDAREGVIQGTIIDNGNIIITGIGALPDSIRKSLYTYFEANDSIVGLGPGVMVLTPNRSVKDVRLNTYWLHQIHESGKPIFVLDSEDKEMFYTILIQWLKEGNQANLNLLSNIIKYSSLSDANFWLNGNGKSLFNLKGIKIKERPVGLRGRLSDEEMERPISREDLVRIGTTWLDARDLSPVSLSDLVRLGVLGAQVQPGDAVPPSDEIVESNNISNVVRPNGRFRLQRDSNQVVENVERNPFDGPF